MYVIIDSNNEVMGNYDDQDFANQIATTDEHTVVSVSAFNFQEDVGYRYIPSQNTFEVYQAPAPAGDDD